MPKPIEDKLSIILDAALICARENGLSNLTKDCVALGAGVAAGTINYTFGNVKGLQDAVVVEAVRRGDLRVIAQALAMDHPAAIAAPADLKMKAALQLVG